MKIRNENGRIVRLMIVKYSVGGGAVCLFELTICTYLTPTIKQNHFFSKIGLKDSFEEKQI